MWLFTKYGFYSSVCARQGDGSPGQPVDANQLMIRARVRGHLEALQARFPEELAAINITETPTTDYRYRMFVDKAVRTPVLRGLSEEMAYEISSRRSPGIKVRQAQTMNKHYTTSGP